MRHSKGLLIQPYAIDLLDEEAELVHRSLDMHLFAELAAQINPVSGLQESLVVPAKEAHSVIGELKALVRQLRHDNAGEDAIASAVRLAHRIETELFQQRILRLAVLHLKDLKAASRWYVLTSIPQLGGKTARDLVDEGRGEEVETFLNTHGLQSAGEDL